MKNVRVLLSTYNGEKYLRQQLESLVNQVGVNLEIVVRDDGSTDKTIEILEEFKSENKLEYTHGENLGYKRSFLTLAYNSINSAEYYAFCDQDDFWEPRKLVSAINALEERKEKYKLYFSNLIVVDKDLNNIGIKDFSFMSNTLGSVMMRNNVAGCSMVFNNSLLELALKNEEIIDKVFSHDSWMYKVCLSVGGVAVFDENSYIKYRQHGKNVTGIKQGMKKRIDSTLKSFTTDKNLRLKSAELLIEEYESIMPRENLEFLLEIKKYNANIFNTVKLATNKQLKFGRISIDVLGRCAILLRKF